MKFTFSLEGVVYLRARAHNLAVTKEECDDLVQAIKLLTERGGLPG